MTGPAETGGSTPSIERFRARFAAATGTDGPHRAWAFGDPGTPDLATNLALLVRDGPKRATTGLLAEYESEGEALPRPGDLHLILDGQGEPVCVIRTTGVEVKRFGDVDDSFAREEGEGDRTLDWWRKAHLRYFERVGSPIDDDSVMVLERFELVWPLPGG